MSGLANTFIKSAYDTGLIQLSLDGFGTDNGTISPYRINFEACMRAETIRMVGDLCTQLIENSEDGLQSRWPDFIIGIAPWGHELATVISAYLADGHNDCHKIVYGCVQGGVLTHQNQPLLPRLLHRKRVLVVSVAATVKECSHAFEVLERIGAIPIGGVIAFNALEDIREEIPLESKHLTLTDMKVRSVATIDDLIQMVRRKRHRDGWSRLLAHLLTFRIQECRSKS